MRLYDIFASIALGLLPGLGIAQTFSAVPGPLLVQEVAFNQANECYIHLNNPSGAPLQLRWRRLEMNLPHDWNVDLCDYGLCYAGIPSNGTMNPIQDTVEAYLKLIVQPNNSAGTGWLWFRAYELGNDSNFVDVYFSLHTPGTSGVTAPDIAVDVRVFPNPASDAFFLENKMEYQTPAPARILNAMGIVLWEQTIAAEQTVRVEAAGWARGVYFVEIAGEVKRLFLH